MSSNKQSNAFDMDAYLAGALLLIVLTLRYEAQLMQAVTTILVIVSAGALLFGTWRFVHQYRKGGSTLRSPTGTDVDLTTIEDEDFDEEIIWEGPDGPMPVKHILEPPVSTTPFVVKTQYNPDPLLDGPVHRANAITTVQADTLERTGYHKQDFVPLGAKGRQSFYIRPEGDGNLEHTFVVQNIIQLLKGKAEVSRSTPPTEPDVVFWCKGKGYALEVETPLRTRQKGRLRDMTKRNNSRFGANWCIVVTQSAYAKQFQRYQQVLTRNQVGAWIAETIQQPRSGPPYLQDNATQNSLSKA